MLAATVDNLRKISLLGQLSWTESVTSCFFLAKYSLGGSITPPPTQRSDGGGSDLSRWAVLSVSLSTLCAGLDTEVTTPRLFSLYPDSGPWAGIVFLSWDAASPPPDISKSRALNACWLSARQREGSSPRLLFPQSASGPGVGGRK